eukprot:4920555-Alexandrium_andersonii.AAC.1
MRHRLLSSGRGTHSEAAGWKGHRFCHKLEKTLVQLDAGSSVGYVWAIFPPGPAQPCRFEA